MPQPKNSATADYFSPESISSPNSGAGGILGGKTVAIDGGKTSMGGPSDGASVPLPPLASGEGEGGDEGIELSTGDDGETELPQDGTTELAENGQTEMPANGKLDEGALQEAMAAKEQEQFEAAAASLRQAIENVPELLELQDSLMIEQTPEGLRIQLVDQKGYSMFALGSSQPNEQTRNLVQLVTRAVGQLPHKISISGYTDSRAYRSQEGYTNWELSSDRANSARRLLIEAGLSSERIALVQGRADTDPLLPDEPESERNRRISIVLLRENAVPINIQDTVSPSELGASELPTEPSRKTELESVNVPG